MATHSLRGFTLIELLISISIIGIITALVMVKFSAFDSTVLLKSAAYEVALAIRDAQVYSVSVNAGLDETGSNYFDYSYGVKFTPNSKEYKLFRYWNKDNPTAVPRSTHLIGQNGHRAEFMTTFTLGGSIIIEDICVTRAANIVYPGENCVSDFETGKQYIDIAFRRPDFDMRSFAEKFVGPPGTQPASLSAKIYLKSTKGSDVWIVEVGRLGNISVYKYIPN